MFVSLDVHFVLCLPAGFYDDFEPPSPRLRLYLIVERFSIGALEILTWYCKDLKADSSSWSASSSFALMKQCFVNATWISNESVAGMSLLSRNPSRER